MATTKQRIADEILNILSGGRVGSGTKFHINEIKISVAQVANQLLKMEYLQVNIPMGEMIPNGAAIATYENILITQYKNVSKITLPCYPLKLPRGIGVYQIFNPNDVNSLFIPVEPGMIGLIQSQPVLNTLLGYTAYEPYGTDVIFSKDLSIPNTAVYVTVRLVVLDITQYSDWDPLPLGPEQEWQIKAEVLKIYSAEPITDKLVDPGTKEESKVPTNQQAQS